MLPNGYAIAALKLINLSRLPRHTTQLVGSRNQFCQSLTLMIVIKRHETFFNFRPGNQNRKLDHLKYIRRCCNIGDDPGFSFRHCWLSKTRICLDLVSLYLRFVSHFILRFLSSSLRSDSGDRRARRKNLTFFRSEQCRFFCSARNIFQ